MKAASVPIIEEPPCDDDEDSDSDLVDLDPSENCLLCGKVLPNSFVMNHHFKTCFKIMYKQS